jgi:DNA-binding CsgD family transcriptional regulator
MTARTMDRILHHTGGNPLYLETLLKEVPPALLSDGQQPLPTPNSLVSVLRRQLVALPEESQRLVEAAAIVEWPTPLARVARIARVADLTAAAPAVGAGLLLQRPGDEGMVTVAHAVQRNAIEAAISPVRRRALHQAAAQVLEPDLTWRHRVAASNGPDAELAAELECEAQQQLRAGAVERAATLLLWASETAASRVDHEWLLLVAVAQLMWNEQYERARALMPRVHACAPHPLRHLVLGSWAMRCTAMSEAEVLLNQALHGAENRSDQQWIAGMAGLYLSSLHVICGQGGRALKAAQRVLALKGLEAGLATRARAQLALAGGLVSGPAAGRRQTAESEPETLSGETGSGTADLVLAQGLFRSARGELTRGAADLAIALRSTGGQPVMAEVARAQLAADRYLLGAWDAVATFGDRMITPAETHGMSWTRVLAYPVAAWVSAGRGDGDRAEELIRLSEERVSAMSETLPRVLLCIARALLCQSRGDYAEMLSAVEPLRRGGKQGHAGWYEIHWRPLQIESLINTGRLDEADQAMVRLRRLARRTPCLHTVTAWLLGQLAEAQGDLSMADRHYERGLALPTSSDDPPLHRARLEQAHGSLRGVLKDRRAAESLLRKAAQDLSALGAEPFARRCECDLAVVIRGLEGASRTLPVMSHFDELPRLTDRECQIARLAARGLTNREIATDLRISTKTIEYHLNRVYAKLRLTGRQQLRVFMGDMALV